MTSLLFRLSAPEMSRGCPVEGNRDASRGVTPHAAAIGLAAIGWIVTAISVIALAEVTTV
jgi:hypothetical protein